MTDIKNYAVVDETSKVINVIAWDGLSPYNPGAGLVLVQSGTAAIGDVYAEGIFARPADVPEEEGA